MTELLGLPDSFSTSALAVSADGTVVAGFGNAANTPSSIALRWAGAPLAQGLPGRGGSAGIREISADGSTIAGESYDARSISQHAVIWRGEELTDLGTIGLGKWSYSSGISDDGSVVVGSSTVDAGDSYYHAFRWVDGLGMQDLGALTGTASYGRAVSGDGQVVVGSVYFSTDSYYNYYYQHAFRWENDAMVDLGTLGGENSRAADVSADGTVVVGESQVAVTGYYHAFRWENGAMVDLGTVDGAIYSNARKVSADGTAIAGDSRFSGNGGEHAFWWSEATKIVDLGTLGGNASFTADLSADGTTVVGLSSLENGDRHAFHWTQANGMVDLGVLDGMTSSAAAAVSADGTITVGTSSDYGKGITRAFIYAASSGMLDLANTGASMAATAGDLGAAGAQQLMKVAQVGTNEIRLINAGPRLSSKGTAGVAPVPVGLRLGAGVVDASGSGTLSFGDIGVAAAVAPGFTLGGALSLSSGSSDIETVDYDGQMVAGALYLRHEPANGQGLTWKLALAHGAGDVEVMRPATLSNTEAGHGTTRLSASTAAVELGWRKPLAQGEVTPYLRLERSRMKRAGYTEANDIGFPVTWEGQSVDLWAATLGVSGRQVLSPRDTLRYDIGLSVDLDRDADDISGTSGAGAITAPALAVNHKARLEASIGYDHRLAAGGTVNLDLGVAQTAYSAGLTKTLRIGYETRF